MKAKGCEFCETPGLNRQKNEKFECPYCGKQWNGGIAGKHTAFQVAFLKLIEQSGEIASRFGVSGHRAQMSHLEEQLLRRVEEFLEVVDKDRQPQVCDGCGRGSAKIGGKCDHCGEVIECAAY